MNRPDAGCAVAIVIVNYGGGSRILKIARHGGVGETAVFLGTGTAKNRLLAFLALADVRKEIVLLFAEKTVLDAAVRAIDSEMDLSKPNHGIAFIMPLEAKPTREEAMYQTVIAIVGRDMAETAMEAAAGAGARGGTIINARGAGPEETGRLLHMDIEPEKEILLVLAETPAARKIADAIYARLEMDKDGHGTVFCQDINAVYGVR